MRTTSYIIVASHAHIVCDSQRKRARATEEAVHEAGQVRPSCTVLAPRLSDDLGYSDGSGSIDREEFLQIPQIANNPLAARLIAIFDEEYVVAVDHPLLLIRR